jgi:mono/diheme cytochrome c family protein
MKKVGLSLLALMLVVYLLYEALIYYDNNFRYGRMRETPAIRPLEEPVLVEETGLVPFSGGEENLRVLSAEELKSPLPVNDPETLEIGKTIYFTYCAQCHGKYHDGNGTVGQSFAPLPTDLKTETVQSKSDGALFREISYGIPNGRQPPLATTIDIADRWRVIAYVKSLGIRP